jgi:uncharacterized membrane protein YqjE
MAGETMPSRSSAGQAGILNNLLALASAVAGFLESRAALFAKESKRAVIQLAAIAACLAAALMFLAFGYVFILAAAVVAIARALQMSWVWVALVTGGIHFIVAIFLLLFAQAAMRKPFFRATVEELKQDREWLETLNETASN